MALMQVIFKSLPTGQLAQPSKSIVSTVDALSDWVGTGATVAMITARLALPALLVGVVVLRFPQTGSQSTSILMMATYWVVVVVVVVQLTMILAQVEMLAVVVVVVQALP
jgi:hypothetical protein